MKFNMPTLKQRRFVHKEQKNLVYTPPQQIMISKQQDLFYLKATVPTARMSFHPSSAPPLSWKPASMATQISLNYTSSITQTSTPRVDTAGQLFITLVKILSQNACHSYLLPEPTRILKTAKERLLESVLPRTPKRVLK